MDKSTLSLTGCWLLAAAFIGVPWAFPFSWPGFGDEPACRFVELAVDFSKGLELESWSTADCALLASHPGNGGPVCPGVGVMGFPPLINSTISSASLERSPSGRNGLSQPLSVLKNSFLPLVLTRPVGASSFSRPGLLNVWIVEILAKLKHSWTEN